MAITDSLISFWELEEASGTRNDSFSTNHLTDNNTVTQSAGKVGNAATFTTANSESLTRADNASLSTGNIDFSIALWVNPSAVSSKGVFYKGDSSGIEYALTTRGTGVFRFEVDSAAGLAGINQVESTTTYTTSTWYFVVCQHDSVNDLIKISVNGGTFDTTAYSAGCWDSATSLYIGTDGDFGDFFGGSIDQAGFWKKILDSSDITFLYNSGSGRSYAEIAPAASPKLPMPPFLQAVNRGAFF